MKFLFLHYVNSYCLEDNLTSKEKTKLRNLNSIFKLSNRKIQVQYKLRFSFLVNQTLKQSYHDKQNKNTEA
ncbi:hypothetical protein HYN43_025385 [Mucilaginibacter celer]|uniref:Uncharacterized protein n=1 Tax=Mucilaginibacter celer TaxID=2305508 RepID=A0A494W3V0_9SPHI|nr:hypothetical protein HYN43_025385 [Mucilaginibacter celer]